MAQGYRAGPIRPASAGDPVNPAAVDMRRWLDASVGGDTG
jgi:hypothetical protein